MDEDASSMVSNAKINGTAETSDSNNSNYACRGSKRPRHETNNTNIPIAKFKGVVPQQNGHWGAQIYANHQRIWLGTFKSEKEAAMAYDRAAIKLRSGDSHRNFPWTDENVQEPNFQKVYTTDTVLNMIRDGSYQSKFEDFLKTLSQRVEIGTSLDQRMVQAIGHLSCMQLFQKELTPSDVGKLNRLVIPKKYAVKYFPYICESEDNNVVNSGAVAAGGSGCGVDDIELVFYDRLMRTWKFRYCYWRSSQSFVFTRGWNRFVKEKNLRERDTITFYTCDCPGGEKAGQNFFLIDVSHYGETSCNNGDHEQKSMLNNNGLMDSSGDDEHLEVELELNLGTNFSCRVDEVKADNRLGSPHEVEAKRVRLFGVQLN